MTYVKYIGVAAILAVIFPGVAFAQIVISEIQYDLEGTDSGHEWVEVFNSGSSLITLTEWKLLEAGVNHGIKAHSGAETLVGGAYAIIADNPTKFLEDWPNYTGALYDSAFSLSNTGELLTMRCCGSGDELTDQDSVTYSSDQGAAGDGNTLHRTSVSSAALSVGTPTPGEGQLQADNNSGTSEDNNLPAFSDASSGSGASTSSSGTLARVNAGNNRVAIIDIDTHFEGKAYDSGNRTVEAQFRWNFGDGATSVGKTVVHKWEYPGRYVVVLEAERFGVTKSDRITVTAAFAQISFDVLSDGGISIENLSSREIDLSGWSIRENSMEFTFPENTIVLRDSAIRLSFTALRFYATTQVQLLYPNGHVAFDATSPISENDSENEEVNSEVTAAITAEVYLGEDISTNKEAFIYEVVATEEDPLFDESQESEDENIENVAAVGASEPGDGLSVLWWLGMVLVVGLSATAVILGRRVGHRGWIIIEDTSE